MNSKMKSDTLIDYAIIFCGGKGTRLGTIGKKNNKSMLLYKEKPIIYYIIKQLLDYNISKIILPLGFKGKKIKQYISKEFIYCLSKFVFVETGLDTEISIRIEKIKKFFPKNKSLLFLNGDTIFNFDLKNFLKSHKNNNKAISLALFQAKIDIGFVKTKNKIPVKFIKNIFVRKFHSLHNMYEAYSGIFLAKSNYILNHKFDKKKDFELEIFNKSIKNKNLGIYKIQGLCFPIDNIKNLNYAELNINVL